MPIKYVIWKVEAQLSPLEQLRPAEIPIQGNRWQLGF